MAGFFLPFFFLCSRDFLWIPDALSLKLAVRNLCDVNQCIAQIIFFHSWASGAPYSLSMAE